MLFLGSVKKQLIVSILIFIKLSAWALGSTDPVFQLAVDDPAPIESKGNITITVARSGSSEGEISVTLSTAPLSATSPEDFTAINQTLTWLDGDSSDQTVNLALIDDALPEAAQEFAIELSNPTSNSALGEPNRVVVTITDDDGELPVIFGLLELNLSTLNREYSLTPEVASPTPVSYQWFKDGIAIPGETEQILTFQRFPFSYETMGTYTLEATNSAGSVLSNEARVQLFPQDYMLGTYPIIDGSSTVADAGDGKVWVGGSFGGTSYRNWVAGATFIQDHESRRLLLINPDGTPDRSFVSPLTESSNASIIRVSSDGFLYVHTSKSSATDYRLWKISTEGVIDTAWSDLASAAIDGLVSDLELMSDGSLIAVGNFTGGLLRLAPSGQPDLSFPPALPDLSPVFRNVEIVDQTIYIGGRFQWSTSPDFSHLMKLGPDGTIDAAFTPDLNDEANLGISSLSLGANGILIANRLGENDSTILSIASADSSVQEVASLPFHSEVLSLADGRILALPATEISVSDDLHPRLYAADGTPDDIFLQLMAGGLLQSYHLTFDAIQTTEGSVWLSGPDRFNGIYTGDPSAFELRIDFPLVDFVQQPTDLEVDSGVEAEFLAYVSGTVDTSNLALQWFKDGAPLSNGPNISGALSNRLVLTNTTPSDNGSYTLVVTSSDETTYLSDPAELFVLAQPIITWGQDNPTAIEKDIEQTLSFDLQGVLPMTWSLLRDGTSIATGTAGAQGLVEIWITESSLGVANYQITAGNQLGNSTSINFPIETFQAPNSIATDFVNGIASTISTEGIRSITPSRTGGVIIAGDWTNWQFAGDTTSSPFIPPNRYSGIVRLNPDGTRDQSFDPGTDLSFTPTGYEHSVELPDGSVLFVSSQISGSNFSAQQLVLFDSSGNHVSSFTENIGSGPNGIIRDTIVDSLGRLIIVGDFSTFDGGVARSIARLNQDGTLDTTFAPSFPFSSSEKIAETTDGSYLVRTFLTVQKIASDGTHQTGFEIHSNDLILGSIGSFITDFAIASDGSIYVLTTRSIHRLTSEGLIDETFSESTFPSESYSQITIDHQDLPIVFGGSSGEVSRFLADGTIDSSFALPTQIEALQAYTITPEGAIWIGGTPTRQSSSDTFAYLKLEGEVIPVVILSQPISQPIEAGADHTLSVVASGTNALSYQWFKDSTQLSDNNAFSGTNTANLTLNSASEAEQGSYSVVVTNSATADSVSSRTAHITLRGIIEITATPLLTRTATGSSFVLEILANGSAPFTYQWFKNGSPITHDPERILGAQTSTLSITNATIADSGSYSLTITNSIGTTVSEDITVDVLRNPTTFVDGFTPPTDHTESISAVLPHPDGTRILVGYTSGPNTLRVYYKDGTRDLDSQVHVNGAIHDIAQGIDGKILICGDFNQVNGIALQKQARFNADLTLDEEFSLSNSVSEGTVTTIHQSPTGTIYVGGSFDQFLIRRRPDGQNFPGQISLFPEFSVRAICDSPSGGVYVGGLLADTTVMNTDDPTPPVVHILPDGTTDPLFLPRMKLSASHMALSPDGKLLYLAQEDSILAIDSKTGEFQFEFLNPAPSSVRALAIQENGSILAGYQSAPFLRRFTSDGQLDPTWDPPATPNLITQAIAFDSDGSIWLGGSFLTITGEVRRLLHLVGDAPDFEQQRQFYLDYFQVPVDQRGMNQDPDMDGVPNELEFLYRLNPSQASHFQWSTMGGIYSRSQLAIDYPEANLPDDDQYALMEVTVPKNTRGVTIDLRGADDLDFAQPVTLTAIQTRSLDADFEMKTFVFPTSTSSQTRGFFRLVISR